jgi:hypothetical protein
MAHGTRFSGINKAVVAGFTRISGVNKKITKGLAMVNGVKMDITFGPQIELAPFFADNTWEQIIAACQEKRIPDTWNVGDSKTMTINGTSYPIIIIGKNHDVYSDGSGTAPLTFRMNECYHQLYTMHGSLGYAQGWPSSDMRLGYLPALLTKMPAVVQSSIREVNKETTNGKGAAEKVTVSDKLFLLSESEMTGARSIYQNVAVGLEGSKYEYFLDSSYYNVAMMESRSKSYWLRTAADFSDAFRTWSCASSRFNLASAYPNPTYYEGNYPVDGYHIAPAFCF